MIKKIAAYASGFLYEDLPEGDGPMTEWQPDRRRTRRPENRRTANGRRGEGLKCPDRENRDARCSTPARS